MEDIEINQLPKCVHCGTQDNLGKYETPEGVSLLCLDCAAELNKKVETYKEQKNHFVSGFFASLLGAIAGSVLWIALGMINFYASFAGYAIAFAAFWAYSKAGGKLTKAGVVINIVTVIVGILFAEYTGLVLAIWRANPGYSFIEYVAYINSILFLPEFLKSECINFVLGILFAFLGCHNIIRNNMTTAKKMENFWIKKID